MKKSIITAVNHSGIEEYLKLNCQEKYDILKEDFVYQDGVLEYLKNNKTDVLILSEVLPGKYNRYEYIEEIRNTDNEMKIIIILSQEDVEYKNYLISKGIFDHLINGQAEYSDLIFAIDKEPNVIVKTEIPKDIDEKLKNLKTLLDNEKKKNKSNMIYVPQIIEKETYVEKVFTQKQEIIAVWSPTHSGASDFATQIAVTLSKKSSAKILLIDFNIYNPSLDIYFGIEKEPEDVEYYLGEDRSSGINYMVDAIDKDELTKENFERYIIKYKHADNLNILTGNYSLYMYQNILCERYYHKILEKAKELYDFIIIDTSGFLTVSSTQYALKNSTTIF
jgi:DNA-binding NarL/FixJ family response regulator